MFFYIHARFFKDPCCFLHAWSLPLITKETRLMSCVRRKHKKHVYDKTFTLSEILNFKIVFHAVHAEM